MYLVSIQSKAVLDILKNNEIYYAKKTTNKDLRSPYDRMSKHYKWTSSPIFACVVNRRYDFYGANFDNSIILVLKVPKSIVKLQVYYDWTDMIYYMKHQTEWELGNLNNFISTTLDGYRTNKRSEPIQATIPYIKKEWLINTKIIDKDFIDKYIKNSNNKILSKVDFINKKEGLFI